MSETTIQLRMILESYDIRNTALGDYPIFDEGHRRVLNDKIIRRYSMHDIAHETPDLFVHFLHAHMHEVMPFYNKLYVSELMVVDPLLTVDLRTDNTGSTRDENRATGATSSDSETKGTSRNISSDYPQSMLSGSGDYASSGADVSSTGTSGDSATSEQEGSSEGHSEGSSVTRGRSGSVAGLVAEYRDTLLNIDVEVVDSLSGLFSMVWTPRTRDSVNDLYYPLMMF